MEIFGLGVGLDLSPYYARSQVVDPSAVVRHEALGEIVGLLGRGRSGRRLA